jgi:hypothetical protein
MIATWEIHQGDPYLGSELLAVVRRAGPELPENWVRYGTIRDHLRQMNLDGTAIAAVRRKGAATPAGESLTGQIERLGW